MIKQRDWQIKKKEGYKNAVKIVNRIESNDTNEAVDQMKDSLDERIHRRIEPCLIWLVMILQSRSLDKYSYTV